MPLLVGGTATYAGVISCDFSFSGTGVIENNDTLTIPYSGTSLRHSGFSGTERLHRPAPAAAPRPAPDADAGPAGRAGGSSVRVRFDRGPRQLVECIWDHIHPTDPSRRST